jgi:hypothetical protein
MYDENSREALDRRGNPGAHQAVPTQSTVQIANTLHRPYSAIRRRAAELRSEGLLESKNAPRVRSIKPDPRDFDDVERDYCRKHRITIAELDARFERDNQLAAQLYRQAAKPTRLRSRRISGKTPGTGSSITPATSANGAPTRQRRA